MPRIFNKSFAKICLLYACLGVAALQFSGCSSREQRAQNYYDQGMSYLAKKDYVKARLELRNALQLKTEMIEAWRALAEVDEHDHNWQALTASLRRIAEIDQKDVNIRLRLARLLLLGGGLDEALKTINAANDIDPRSAAILAEKAGILLRLKDNDGATLAAQNALALDPGNAEANVVLAVPKFAQGDNDGALQILANVTSANQEDLGVLFLKINIFERMGNLEQVQSLLRKLILSYPKEPLFQTQLIMFYLAHQRPDDAVKELRALVAADPTDTNAELNLVNLLGAVKGPAAARTELDTRIDAGGRVFPYQLALAKLDFTQGRVDDSTKLLEKLISSSSSADDVLTARITLAEMDLNKKDIAAVESLVSDILRVDSRNTDGLRLRALIRIDRSQFDDAIADLRSALNDQPQSPPLLAALAVAYERSGSIELADKAYLDATKASGFAPAFGLNYVAFLERRGLSAQVDNVLVDLAGRNPNNIAILSTLAQARLARQDWVGAHAVADEIRRLGGDKSDIADQIQGAAFSGQGKLNESLAALQSAYDANPGAVQPMTAMVRGYLQAKQTDKAKAFLQEALKANPGNAEALVLMGSIHNANNDPGQAENDFETAIKQQPKNAIGYLALAEFYARQKKFDQALQIAKTGHQQQPKDFALQFTLAGILAAKGEFDAAISELESMLIDQPGALIVANDLASLLADHRTDKASVERANSLAILLRNSPVPLFQDTVGWVEYRQGNLSAAVPLLEDAAAKLPNLPIVRYHLGVTYLATGQDEKASSEFKKAQELAPADAELKQKIDATLKARSDAPKG